MQNVCDALQYCICFCCKGRRTSHLLTSILSLIINRARGNQRMEIRRINRIAVSQGTRRRRQPRHWPPGVWQAGRCCGTLGGQTGVLIKKKKHFFCKIWGFSHLSKCRLIQNLLGASTLSIKLGSNSSKYFSYVQFFI